jgi:hypothetical protein
MKQYINPLLTAGSLLLLLTTIYFQNERINQFKVEVKSLQSTIDSLHDADFNNKSEIGRHELTREEILNKYPKVLKEYNAYYEHETE